MRKNKIDKQFEELVNYYTTEEVLKHTVRALRKKLKDVRNWQAKLPNHDFSIQIGAIKREIRLLNDLRCQLVDGTEAYKIYAETNEILKEG